MPENITNPAEVVQQPKVDIKLLKKMKGAEILINAIKNHEAGIRIFHGQYYDERTAHMFGEDDIKAVVSHPDYALVRNSFEKLERQREASMQNDAGRGA